MSWFLSPLPLLVVGCMVLQALIVSAEDEKAVQLIDNQSLDVYVPFDEYARIENKKRKKPPAQKKKQKPKRRKLPVCKERKPEASARLVYMNYDSNKRNELLKKHLPFKYDDKKMSDEGLQLLVQDGFVIRYSDERKTPLFTSQKLDGKVLKQVEDAGQKPVRDTNEWFRKDTRLKKKVRSMPKDYRSSKFDRGHFAPAADIITDNVHQMNTFILSNMGPQHPLHNQQAWNSWEGYIRKKAKEKGEEDISLFVITGTTILPNAAPIKKGTTLKVPHKWYKLLAWCERGTIHAEYIFALHVNSITPSIEWASTEESLSHRGSTAEKKTAQQILEFVKDETKIDFKFADSECHGNTFVAQGLAEVVENANAMDIENAEVTSASKFCEKLKSRLHHLARMKKVSLSDHKCSKVKGKRMWTILELGKGSFSAGCRKSELLSTENVVEDDQMIDNPLDTIEMEHGYALPQKADEPLTAIVPKRQTVRLLDVLGVPKKRILSAINVRLQNITVDCAAKQVDIHSAPLGKIDFIPRVFSVTSTVFSVRINYGKKYIIAAVSGQWALGSILLDVLARYNTNNMKLLLRGAPKKGITINLKKELKSLTGTNIPIPLPSVSLTNIAVTGQIDLMKGGLATVVVSGSIGRNRVHAVFQKPLKSGKFTGAFAADIGPIKLSDLIRKTTRVDISRVPFFGSLTIPRLGVTVSSEYITSSLLPNVFCKNGLLQNTAVTIPKGLQAFTVLNLKGKRVHLKMYYFETSLSFEVIKDGRLPIGSLLSTIPGINIRSLPIPPGIRDIFKFQIDYFSLDTSSKKLVIDTQFPGTLRYFKGYLTITKPALRVNAILKHPRKIDLELDGAIKIGKGDYVITISRDPSSKKYVLKAFFETIPISDLIHKFSAKVLPRAFQKRLGKFIQFSIHNAKLAFPLGTRNLQLHLSGTPVIGGYKTVHMSAVIIRQGGKTKFITGLQFGKVSLATLLNKITGKNMRGIAILNQELDTSFIISPVSLPGVHLYGSKLKDISIVKGVSIHAILQWPPNCAQDKFCAVAQRVLGKNAKLSLQASIQSTSSYTLSAGVSKVRLGGGVVLQRAALQIKAGAESSVGIYGEIHLSKVGITLSAGLRSGSRGVVLEGNMQGCWKKAFGAKWLSICNLHLLIAIQPTVTLVGALEIGGQVRIGNPSCIRHPLIALGYMGVDQLSPNNNFYYVQLKNKVTMGTLLQAFCIKFQLPRPLADSGFPRGFLNSFSPIGKELPKAGISIPPGYRIKGTINILGLEAHADVTLSLPKGVNMNIALSPLKIGKGLLQMYASRSRKRGPFLKVIVESHPRRKVDIHASGFVSVLGIQAEAMLRITNTKYEYMVRGKFLNLFQASLHITASYGNIKKTGFRVRGYLKNDFFAVIRRKIQRALTSFSGKATKAIDNAMSKVNSKKAVFNRAIGKLNNAKHRVNNAKRVFDRAAHKMRQWQNKVNRLCRTRNCGRKRICYPCFERKCKRFWGKERCWHQPKKCCRYITDPVCRARNAACNVARRAAYHGLRVAQGIVQRSKGVLNVAKGALEAAKRVVDISKRPLDLANAFLRSVKNSLKAGLNAVSVVAKHGLGGVFDIRELKFDVALSSAATGHFRVSVLVSIFRKLKRFSLNINLKNLLSFVKAIGAKIFHRLKSFIR